MSAINTASIAKGTNREIVGTLTLAWPIILGQLAQTLQFSSNTLLMGWLGASELAAGALAMALLHPLLMFMGGVLSVVSSLVAQALGRGDSDGGRVSFQQGLWLCLLVSIITTPMFFNISPALHLLGQAPDVSAKAAEFGSIIGFVILPNLGFVLLRNFLASHGLTFVALGAVLIATAINFGMGYVLTTGVMGLPEMGLAGIGVATVVSNFLCIIGLMIYVRYNRHFAHYRYYAGWHKLDPKEFWRLLRIGLPIGLFLLSEVVLFTSANFLMGSIGPDSLAGHAVSSQYIGLAFSIPIGLGVAAMVRVGWAYGARDVGSMARAGWTAIGLCTFAMIASSTLYILMPDALVGFFLDRANPDNAGAFPLAITFLSLVGILQLSDGLQGLMSYVLRGLSDTFIPMMFGIIGYWPIGLTFSIGLGLFTDLGGVGVYIGILIGVSLVAVALLIRFTVLIRRFRRIDFDWDATVSNVKKAQ